MASARTLAKALATTAAIPGILTTAAANSTGVLTAAIPGVLAATAIPGILVAAAISGVGGLPVALALIAALPVALIGL